MTEPNGTAVLVHGGFLGPWIWADTVSLLDARGVRSVTVDLPSCRDGGGRLAGLHDDAEAVRGALDGCDGAVLCGHSYAGAAISEAAAGPHPAADLGGGPRGRGPGLRPDGARAPRRHRVRLCARA